MCPSPDLLRDFSGSGLHAGQFQLNQLISGVNNEAKLLCWAEYKKYLNNEEKDTDFLSQHY